MRLMLSILVICLVLSCGGPIARFTFVQEKTEAPSTIDFVNESTGAEEYQWHFGDSMMSGEINPEHQYMSSGQYLVILEARKGNKSKTYQKTITVQAPEKCLVQLSTDYGDMIIQLYNETPLHRDNFLKLAGEGYFNDMLFHRVIEGFMIQGGDPDSKNAAPGRALGMGGPGYQIPAEFVDSLLHIKGAIAAARQGDITNPEKKSSGSQFYIVQGQELTEDMIAQMERRGGFAYTDDQKLKYLTFGGSPFLDRQYTVFGQVLEGLDVIDKIAAAKTDGRDRPTEDIKMTVKVIQ